MNRIVIVTQLLLIILFTPAQSAEMSAIPQLLSGPYLGQTPPGLIPEVFAEGIISGDLNGSPVFSPDGLEMFYSEMNGTHIMTCAQVDGLWTTPAEASFTAGLNNTWAPCISPDGQKVYFIEIGMKENIWCAEQNGSGWYSPFQLPAAVNSRELHWQPSVASSGNLYYHSLDSGGGDIFRSIYSAGVYQTSQPLPAEINTPDYEHAPYIAPDESYIIFSRSSFGDSLWAELYISFRNPDSSWTDAIAMTELNRSYSNEAAPNVTPDGQYLFYLSNTDSGFTAHWVSAGIIDHYRPSQFTQITEGPHVNDSAGSAGVCFIDYDDDTFLDLYVCNSRYPEQWNNRLYRNNGDGTFSEITNLQIVNDNSLASCAGWADYDNDGDLDVFITTFISHTNFLFDNDGAGGFTRNYSTPIDDAINGSTSMSWVDYDGDGILDIFVGNSTDPQSPEYPPFRNFLYRGDGSNFTEITEGEIVTREMHTYSVNWCDYDNDGHPDVVTTGNVGEGSELYHNEGNGTFTFDSTSIVCQSIAGGAGSSWSDFDNDGDMDLFIGSASPGPAYLYQNNGDGSFSEIQNHNLEMSFARIYGGTWADFDNDGDEDILIWGSIYSFEDPDYDSTLGLLFTNVNGTFDLPPDTLMFFGDRKCRTNAWGDYDRDGDLDLYVSMDQIYGWPADNVFYKNNGSANHWITIKPIGTHSNRSAIGTKVRLKAIINGSSTWQMREIMTQTATGSQNPLEAHFGLGDAIFIDSIRVEWPSGMVDILTDIEINQYLPITESLCGDANGDDNVNIGDAVYIVNHIFNGGPPPQPPLAGDANGDGSTNIGDAVYLIYYIFKGGAAPCEGD